jgi:hypothetical protein
MQLRKDENFNQAAILVLLATAQFGTALFLCLMYVTTTLLHTTHPARSAMVVWLHRG